MAVPTEIFACINETHLPSIYFPFCYIFYYQTLVMLKSQGLVSKAPSELLALQQLFLAEARAPQQKVAPLQLPFYNFVCLSVELLEQFCLSPHDISLNLFLVDYHLRKYNYPCELHRRFLGFITAWKRNVDTDEGRLLISLLGERRNSKKSVRLFLKIRKVLLKPVGQKVLQEVSLTHEDAVTIVHTMGVVTADQRRALTKRVNQHFITKNVKYISNTKFNAAVICQFLMEELNDRAINNTGQQQFSSNLTNKINRILDHQKEEILQSEAEQDSQDEEQQMEHVQNVQRQSLSMHSSVQSPPQSNRITFRRLESQKENIKEESMHEKSLVSLDHCMRELSILKERDLQIDNRFRKLHYVREEEF